MRRVFIIVISFIFSFIMDIEVFKVIGENSGDDGVRKRGVNMGYNLVEVWGMLYRGI